MWFRIPCREHLRSEAQADWKWENWMLLTRLRRSPIWESESESQGREILVVHNTSAFCDELPYCHFLMTEDMSDQFHLTIENPFLNLGHYICKLREKVLSPSASPKVVKGRARKSWINRAPASKAAPPRTTGTLTTLGDFECPFAAMMDVQKNWFIWTRTHVSTPWPMVRVFEYITQSLEIYPEWTG